jgi:hypothetical protein
VHVVVELEHHARVPRHGIACAVHLPVPGHAKVNEQRVSGRQQYELVLPAPLDRRDLRAANACDIARRQSATLRRMQNPNVAYGSPDHGGAQDTRGVLDLR